MMRRFALVLIASSATFGCGEASTTPTDAGPDAPAPIPLSSLLSINEVAAYQTVKIDVVRDGAAVSKYNAPLLTAKGGLFRVFYKLEPTKKFRSRTIAAELHLLSGSEEKVLTETKTVIFSSDEDSYPSTFNFPFDEKVLALGTSFYVVLRDPALAPQGAEVAELRYPTENTQALTVTSSPGSVRVVIVPIQYAADQSDRLPETGAAQLESMNAYLTDMYPVSTVAISVRSAPLVWSTPVEANGTGWNELLDAVVDVRTQDKPDSDVYYVGAFEPKTKFFEYCANGCILGLAPNVTGPFDVSDRAVLSIGYAGRQFNETVAHELGHVHGRYHSPCGGAQGTDPTYPYAGGSSGVGGYRISQAALVPSDTYDMMGYCRPEWISDFTYRALFNRVKIVNGAAMSGTLPAVSYERLLVADDGTVIRRTTTMREEPSTEARDVVVTFANGAKRTVRGRWVALDHVGGGFLYVESGSLGSGARVATMMR